METSQLLYKEASELLNNGSTKDAYNKFISVVELSTQQLQGVRFIHQTLVTTPNDYNQLLETMRSSITQLESILSQTTFVNGKPPVPPKPSLRAISKPSISSKRAVPPPLSIVTTDFTFKQNQATNSKTINNNNKMCMDDDDDDDDDDDYDGGNEEIILSAVVDTPSSINKPSLPPRPKNHSNTNYTDLSSSSPLSTSTITSSTCLENIHIDPYDLVPVQTNTGESMALPILPTCTTDFYVPKIPASPLLGLHKELQQQLDLLLQQQKEKKNNNDQRQQQQIASIRKVLTNIRTIYMSAMTVSTIMEFSPELIAYQLTLIESSIFRAIPPEALQQHRSISKIPHPNIVASTDFFNYLTRSIEHSILLPQEASHRAQVVHRWIKIASLCLSLHNYQTLKAIVSALGTPPIQRLKRTWECIPKKRMNKLEMLTSLMSETDNYSKYREHIRTLIPHCHYNRSLNLSMVPFLGVLIHDMTYMLTVNKSSSTSSSPSSSVDDDIRKQEILDWMRTFQRTPAYPLRPPTHFMKKKNGFFSKQNYSPSGIISSTTKSINLQQYHQLLTSTKSISLPSSPSTPHMEDSLLTDIEQENNTVPIEQQRITHYLLMRTWVNEKIIDELSLLREPVIQRKQPPSSSASIQRANSCHSHFSQSTTNHQHYDSMLSMTSSESGNSMIQFDDSSPRTPTVFSFDENQSPSSSKRSFWPFRKSHDLTRFHSTPTSFSSSSPLSSPMSVTKSTTTSDMFLTSLENGTESVKKSIISNRNLNAPHQRSASVPGPLIC